MNITRTDIRSFAQTLLTTTITAIILLFISEPQNGFAQDKPETIRVETNLVLVNVLVRDKNGQLVGGLKSDQFEVWVDGEKRTIESFSAGNASVSYGIVYDLHPTTEESAKAVIESLRMFKAELKTADDIFLVAFNMKGEETFDFIPEFAQLEKHMAEPRKRQPYSLYDANYSASNRIQASRNQKRVLLIISDSADHQSRHNLSEIRKKVSDIKAEIYAIIFDEIEGYGYSDVTHQSKANFPFTRDASALDRAAILDLTLGSGGATYFGPAKYSLRLFSTYKQIASEIGSHYTLGFYPETIDEQPHRVRIGLRDVKGAKDFALSYRMSYQNRKFTYD